MYSIYIFYVYSMYHIYILFYILLFYILKDNEVYIYISRKVYMQYIYLTVLYN